MFKQNTEFERAHNRLQERRTKALLWAKANASERAHGNINLAGMAAIALWTLAVAIAANKEAPASCSQRLSTPQLWSEPL